MAHLNLGSLSLNYVTFYVSISSLLNGAIMRVEWVNAFDLAWLTVILCTDLLCYLLSHTQVKIQVNWIDYFTIGTLEDLNLEVCKHVIENKLKMIFKLIKIVIDNM